MSVTSLAKGLLPSRLREAISRQLHAPRAYAYARRVSRAYAQHYGDAQRRYRADGNAPAPGRPSVERIGVRPLTAGQGGIALPATYDELTGRMQRDVSERLSWSRNSWPFPAISPLPERTDDFHGSRRGEVLTLAMKECLNIDGLEDLCEQLLPEIERCLYGAYVLVDKVYVLRTLPGRHREQSSWIWHYDEHPTEILKLMIYLTDVDEGTAPFTYLARASGEAVLGTKTPLYGQSRIPASTIEGYFARGCRAWSVTGPRGTAVLFNDNVIHRATFAERSYRDALTLQLRPSPVRRRPYVDPRWTGSFQHRDFNRDPGNVAPQLR